MGAAQAEESYKEATDGKDVATKYNINLALVGREWEVYQAELSLLALSMKFCRELHKYILKKISLAAKLVRGPNFRNCPRCGRNLGLLQITPKLFTIEERYN